MKWKHIISAPRDGTHVKLKRVFERELIAEGVGYFGDVTVQYDAQSGGPQIFKAWTRDGEHFFPEPTHWMPISHAARSPESQEHT